MSECAFDGCQRISVIGSCVLELPRHTLYQLVDVIILLAAGFYIFVIFLLEVHHELLNDVFLVLNDFKAGLLLHNDVSVKLFAIFLFFELLPRPVNLNVLLVRGNDLILNLFRTISLQLLLTDAPLVFETVGVRADFRDDLGRLALHLLEQAA